MSKEVELSNFIWSIADLLRGPYRPPQYERVILPLVVLRRFDCVLETTKEKVVQVYAQTRQKHPDFISAHIDLKLNKITGQQFHNHSPLTFEKLKGDPDNIHLHLASYIQGFSENVQEIFNRFEFAAEIERMREHNILYLIILRFCEIDLHPSNVDNIAMGHIFEELIRKFNEQANETAGDHFTPREVIRLMVHLLFINDDASFNASALRKILDPTCGTGGMLSEAKNYFYAPEDGANQKIKLFVYGQDVNPRSYAIAASDLLLKEAPSAQLNSEIKYGDTLTDDQFKDHQFDYFLANPPFGVDWKKQETFIKREATREGFSGRFGAGLPRVNDGSFLFLQHMISKFYPVDKKKSFTGSRLAIVFNGSPLFTGGAGSGESEIRKWIIENDWLEAVVAMPEQMFYNTGIGTYIWIVTNRQGH